MDKSKILGLLLVAGLTTAACGGMRPTTTSVDFQRTGAERELTPLFVGEMPVAVSKFFHNGPHADVILWQNAKGERFLRPQAQLDEGTIPAAMTPYCGDVVDAFHGELPPVFYVCRDAVYSLTVGQYVRVSDDILRLERKKPGDIFFHTATPDRRLYRVSFLDDQQNEVHEGTLYYENGALRYKSHKYGDEIVLGRTQVHKPKTRK